MLPNTLCEIEYHLNVRRATHVAHIEAYKGSLLLNLNCLLILKGFPAASI